MQHKKTVTIKGVVYEIATGKPIAKAAPTKAAAPVHDIKKFARPAPQIAAKPDIAPVVNPVVSKVHAAQAQHTQPRALKPAHVIKQQAIQQALEQAGKHSRKPLKVKKTVYKFQKITRVVAIATAVLVVGACLTYLSMPTITTNIAAAQAGIRASYPSYVPTGYLLSGPVAFDNGIVSMQFKANSAPVFYTVQQARSTWDSSAVRENYVTPNASDKYVTVQTNGLTIYTYGQNAAWVNGGIFYTISGNAPLSPQQIQHIATSM